MVSSPPYAALRAFEAIGRLHGIRRAAEALGTSHAIVSRHLNGLESQLGVCLFDRETRTLTEIGATFHDRISRALFDIIAATQAVLATHDGPLRIVCAPGLALHWLTARLARYDQNQKSPMLVDLQAVDTEPDFTNDEVDGDISYIAGSGLSRQHAAVRCVELAAPPTFPVATPELVERFQLQLKTVADLSRLPLIQERNDREWKGWFAAHDLDDVSFSRVARYGHAHLTLAAARAGQGVALSNNFLAAEDIATGRLSKLTLHEHELKPVELGSYVFRTSKSKWDDPRVIRFRRWLVREFSAAKKEFDAASG